jgi:transposase
VDALIKLSVVATDIFGVSGRAMLEALIAGQRDPKVLAGLARGRLRVKHAALVEALTGRLGDHHARLARMLLDQVDGLTSQIEALTGLIEEAIAAIPAALPPPVDPEDRSGPGDGAPGPASRPLGAVDRLDEVTGIGRHTAQTIIAEVGLNMAQFATPGHLVSWPRSPPAPCSPAPAPAPGRPARATPTCVARSGRPRWQPRRPTPSPGRALPPPGPPPRQAQGPGRDRPLDPGDRLAPAR